MYNRMKKTKAEAGAKGGACQAKDNLSTATTAETLAKMHCVSEKTIRRDGKRADRRHVGVAVWASLVSKRQIIVVCGFCRRRLLCGFRFRVQGQR